MGLLGELPVDELKIDSFFFDEGSDRNRNLTLVESTVELVKKILPYPFAIRIGQRYVKQRYHNIFH